MKCFETHITSADIAEICKVLETGNLGFGENVPKFENRFKSFSQKKFNIATNSASASAFMIFSYLRETYGACDVFTTSLGFTSPAWAAKHFGHNLIFVDVDENLQFDIQDYKDKRGVRCERYSDCFVKPVVMPVLYGGVSNIEGFNEFFDQSGYKEIVVVDSAHCVTPTIRSDYLFFSFHPYKPICTSDGGMISTDNSDANDYFRSYRNFGRKQAGSSYDITQEGFKFYMNNLNATIGLTQLERYEENLEIRKSNYMKMQLSHQYDLLPHDANSSFYFATALTDQADRVIMNQGLARHYPMLHKMTYYNDNRTLPRLESLHHKILNLPLYAPIPKGEF